MCEYRAKEHPALPSDDRTRSLTPNLDRVVTAREAPRSLNVPVGFLVSSFTHTFPWNEFSFRRGVSPSPAETILSVASTGRKSLNFHIDGLRSRLPVDFSLRISGLIIVSNSPAHFRHFWRISSFG